MHRNRVAIIRIDRPAIDPELGMAIVDALAERVPDSVITAGADGTPTIEMTYLDAGLDDTVVKVVEEQLSGLGESARVRFVDEVFISG